MTQDSITTLADVEALEQTPWEQRFTHDNVYDALKATAAQHANKVAVYELDSGQASDEPIATTYADFMRQVHQCANLFTSLGVGSTDVVSTLLPILPDSYAIMWGAEIAGIGNPINPFLEIEQLEGILRAAGTKVLVGCHPSVSPNAWPKIEELRKRLPGLKAVVQVRGPAPDDASVLHYPACLEGQPGDRLVSGRTFKPTDVAAYFHTGGTTGTPKLAQHTHIGQVMQAWTLSLGLDPGADGIGLIGIPLFHVGGALCGGMRTFLNGQTLVTLGPEGFRNPAAVRDFLLNAQRFKCTSLGAVPTIWSAALTLPTDGIDLSTVKNGFVGGSTLSVEVANAVERKFGIKLCEGWGMTEVHGFASMNPSQGVRKIGSVGIRLPYTAIRVARRNDDGSATDCAVDEIGSVLIRGPQVFAGYLDPAHNQTAYVDGDWLDTGDLGRFDADGYIWLTGRAKDLIIRGGHNIDPAVVEEAMYQHPAVGLAAAVGRPDKRLGEMPVAYVQPKPDKTIDLEELGAFVRERVTERAANPAELFEIAEMPVTGVGKIFKPALRLDAARRTFERELSDLDAKVEVVANKVHGALATIRVRDEGDAATARDRLNGYAFHYEVVVVD
ncbi:MAG: acyl-CoA synthetase [Alphaproteobacteria bacterium]